jgi:uncharacterized protein (TIGR02996 family)
VETPGGKEGIVVPPRRKATANTVVSARPEVLAFLQALRENPRDETTRLVLADWFEERGDPRAEYLRAWVEIARLPSTLPERHRREEQFQEAVQQQAAVWLGPLQRLVKYWKFQDGWLDITVNAYTFCSASFARCLDSEVFAWVATVHLDGVTGHWPKVVNAPHLARVRGLDLGGWSTIRAAGAKALAASSHVANLAFLKASGNELGPQGVAALASSPNLAGLRRLDVGNNGAGTAGAQALAASAHMARLTELDLGHNRIGTAGVAALAASPHLSELTALDLGGNGIDVEGIRALLAARFASHLTRLDLGANPVGDEGWPCSRPRGA